jgi:hypothetical protein
VFRCKRTTETSFHPLSRITPSHWRPRIGIILSCSSPASPSSLFTFLSTRSLPTLGPTKSQPAALTLFKMLEARRGAGTTEWTTTGDSVGGTIALDNASRIAAIESLRGTVKNLILHSPLVTFEVDAATEEAANFVSSPVF